MTTIEAPPVALAATVDRRAFADASAWVARGVNPRNSTPILLNILVELVPGGLTMSGFDTSTSVRRSIDADTESSGTFLVSARLLSEIAKALPNKPVQLNVDGNTLTIKAGASRFTLPTANPADYPELPDIPAAIGSVDAGAFADMIDRTKTALGTDDTLPMLLAIQVEFGVDTITTLATDRFRLAINRCAWTNTSGTESTVLVPGKSIAEAAKTTDGHTHIGAEAGVVGFNTDTGTTTTRVVDLDFPDVRRLVPNEFTHAVRVSTAELAAAVKRVSVVAERGNRVVLDIDGEGITIKAGADGEQATDHVDAELIGERITLAFNPQYLLDALTTTAQVTQIGFTGETKPAVFTPPGGEHDITWAAFDDNTIHIVMPVRI